MNKQESLFFFSRLFLTFLTRLPYSLFFLCLSHIDSDPPHTHTRTPPPSKKKGCSETLNIGMNVVKLWIRSVMMGLLEMCLLMNGLDFLFSLSLSYPFNLSAFFSLSLLYPARRDCAEHCLALLETPGPILL